MNSIIIKQLHTIFIIPNGMCKSRENNSLGSIPTNNKKNKCTNFTK